MNAPCFFLFSSILNYQKGMQRYGEYNIETKSFEIFFQLFFMCFSERLFSII